MDDKNVLISAKDNGVSLKQHTDDILKAFEKLKDKINQNDDIINCIKWVIKLHDLGKVLPYFQIVVLENNDYQPWEVDKDLNIYHSLSSILFINQEKLKEKLSNDDKTLQYVLSAIAYHHWKNSLEMDLRYGGEKFEKLLNFEYKQKLVENLKIELEELLNNENTNIIQFNENMCKGLSNGLSFSDYVIPPYQLYWLPKRIELDEEGKKKWILISGFLQRCDHYASFCEEEQFNNIEHIEIENIKYNEILNKVKSKIGTNNSIWQEKKLSDNNYRENLILVAPTGIGKTEFAFLWSNGEKFFYTLPLRAAVEQIFERANIIFGENKVGLLHSDADVYLLGVNYNYERLKVYEVAKELSYPVIISTGDQFFPYGLRPPGYERIYATFYYSRLVIDEIQAYDPRATAIIVKFIEDIYKLGGKFLLMTATLPEYVKKEIKEKIKTNDTKNYIELNIYEEEKTKYQNLKKHKLSFLSISNKKEDNSIDFIIPDEILKDIISKAKENRILIITNTIKQAENVYQKIKNLGREIKDEKGNITEYEFNFDSKQKKEKIKINIKNENIILFHSQFTLNEKQKIKTEIETKFKNPKDPNEIEGKILVATQVIEAAIDIDADILYTEICPMDALVQRMGRVLRRYKENFSLNENDEPNVYIFLFKDGYESGNGRVYDTELIEKTLIYLDNPQCNIKNIYSETNPNKTTDDNLESNNIEKRKNSKKKENSFFNFENLTNIKNNGNYTLLLSEYQKYELVTKLYANLDSNGRYLSKFYETLSILDAGFMSDRKEEAQKIFREIMNADVIDISKKVDFLNKIYNLIQNNNFTYTIFKKEIIANFVISIPYWNLEKIKKGFVSDWIDEIKIESYQDAKKLGKIKEKIKDWCKNIFIVNFKNKNNKKNDERENNIQ